MEVQENYGIVIISDICICFIAFQINFIALLLGYWPKTYLDSLCSYHFLHFEWIDLGISNNQSDIFVLN